MDILGLGLGVTREPYLNTGFEGPREATGEDPELWFDVTKGVDTVTYDSETRAISKIVNSGSATGVRLQAVEGVGAPIFTPTGGQNSLPYSNHDGEGAAFVLTDGDGVEVSYNFGSNYTIFMICDNDAESGVSGITGGRSPNAYAFRWSGSSLLNTVYNEEGFTADTVMPEGAAGFGIATSRVSAVDGTNKISIRFLAQSTAEEDLAAAAVGTSKIYVGKANNGTQFFTGKVYEFGLWRTTLSIEQLNNLDTYVKQKYDFTYPV